MGLDALRAEIHQEAEKGRKTRLDSAKSEAAGIVKKAESEAEAFIANAKVRSLDEAKSLSSLLSAARLDAKKVVAEARDALVDAELSATKKTVLRFGSDKKYPSWLKKRLEAALFKMGKGAKILVRKKDLQLLKKWGFEASEIDCAGGCTVTSPDGRIRVNETLESIFESQLEKMRQKIFEEL